MAKVRVELNKAGVRALLQSPEMLQICERRAQAAFTALGGGYEVTSQVGRTRANARICTTSWRAWHDNMKDNAILKALGAQK